MMPVEVPLRPWRVTVDGWRALQADMTGEAVMVVGATEAAEAVVKAIATIVAMYLAERVVVVKLVVRESRGPRGERVDVVVAPSSAERGRHGKRVHLVAYTHEERVQS